jgi:branched-chain amino acid transport system permease protein
MGVNPNKTQALAWTLAGLFGGLSGALLGSITFVSIDSGSVGLRALPAVLLGGLDSPGGAIIAALALGVSETLFLGYLGHFFAGDVREVFSYVVLLLVLFFVPEGLMGTRMVIRA